MPRKKEAPPPPPKKIDEPPADEGLPLWLATFADMMSLLLCFFILLLSFAQQDISKFKTLMGSIKEAFGVQVERKEASYAAFSPSKFERKEVELEKDEKALLGMVLQMKSIASDLDLDNSMKITTEDDGVIVRIPNDDIFKAGSVEFQPGADKYFESVLRILKDHNFDVVVRGNTDDSPAPGNLYPSNWELSSARAAAALRKLMQMGDISSGRLKAVGYADTLPLLPNTTAENRRANNRLEFFFHKPDERSW